mmetsp:Transcript_85370/g.236572  ORF Transcript_85370/g.236572 Transcript_85370/m.236572 type:complete len:322 (-) Transcript_85370:770-1735(-)
MEQDQHYSMCDSAESKHRRVPTFSLKIVGLLLPLYALPLAKAHALLIRLQTVRESDAIGEHLERLPVLLHKHVPEVDPDVAQVRVVHADPVDVLQVPHGVRVPPRDEDQLAGLLHSGVHLSIPEQWELLEVGRENIWQEVLLKPTLVNVHKISPGEEAPLLPPAEQVEPEVGASAVDVHRALRLIRAYEKARPSVLVPLERSPLEVIASEVLWDSKSRIWGWSKDLRTMPRETPVMEIPTAPGFVGCEGVQELRQRQDARVLQSPPGLPPGVLPSEGRCHVAALSEKVHGPRRFLGDVQAGDDHGMARLGVAVQELLHRQF